MALQRGAESRKDGARMTKADQVAEVLRYEIVTGLQPHGSELPPEGIIIQRFGISRPSYREALRVLETEGLVEVSRGARGGAKVLLPRIETLSQALGTHLQMREVSASQLFQMRLLIEPPVMAEIASRRDQDAIGLLAQCAAAQRYSVHNRSAFHAHEETFRRTIFKYCENVVHETIGLILDSVFTQHNRNMSRRIPTIEFEADELLESINLKGEVIALLDAGEAEAADAAWRRYIERHWKGIERLGGISPIEVIARDQRPAGYEDLSLEVQARR